MKRNVLKKNLVKMNIMTTDVKYQADLYLIYFKIIIIISNPFFAKRERERERERESKAKKLGLDPRVMVMVTSRVSS